MMILFIYGIVYNEPQMFVQLSFIITIIIALYLMYRFNHFRRTRKITLMDQKMCSFAGFYLIITSFGDIITFYLKDIVTYLKA